MVVQELYRGVNEIEYDVVIRIYLDGIIKIIVNNWGLFLKTTKIDPCI